MNSFFNKCSLCFASSFNEISDLTKSKSESVKISVSYLFKPFLNYSSIIIAPFCFLVSFKQLCLSLGEIPHQLIG